MEQILGHPSFRQERRGICGVAGISFDGRPYAPHEWPLARAIATGEVVSGEEIRIERLDGRHMALLVSAAPIRDRLGNILAGIVVDQDITEHRQTSDRAENQRASGATGAS